MDEIETEELPAEEVEVEAEEAEVEEAEVEDAEAEDDEPAAQVAPPSRKPGRANDRIRALDERARKAETEKTQLQQQLQQIMAQQQANQQAQQAQADNERMALMDPAERQAYVAQQVAHRTQQQLQHVQLQLADTTDLTQYQMKAAANPIYARYADRVEQTLADLRSKGMTAAREKVLAFVIGEDALRKAAPGGKAKAGAQRVAAAKGRPVSARGDGRAASSGGDDVASLASRLRGVQL